MLPRENWKTNKIKINDFGLFWQIGFQLLRDEHAIELFKRAKKFFHIPSAEDLFAGTTIIRPPIIREAPPLYTPSLEEKVVVSHKELQKQIAEIGKLQFYYTDTEYPIELTGEKKNLDVVWKREIDGVPTFAFEIELTGMVEKAIDRLQFAFRKWSSRPRIIVPKKLLKKVRNVIGITEREFAKEIKIYEPAQILDLWRKKHDLRSTEQNLGIY